MGTSSSSTVFNGNNFVDNLKLVLAKNIANTNIGSTPFQAQSYMASLFSDNFFIVITTANAPFGNWQEFQASWNAGQALPANDTTLQSRFLVDFQNAIGYPNDFPSGLNITNADVLAWFQNSMSDFLAHYPYVNGSSGNTQTFFTNWANYMANAANIQTDATVNVGFGTVSVANYMTVYEAFFPQQPGETAQDVQNRFDAELQSFISDQISTNGSGVVANGWFIPSQSFNAWFNRELKKFNAGNTKTNVELQSTVDTNGSAASLLVVSRILALLTKTINLLQQISASQAQHLSFQTSWQSNYTTLLTQVPQFAAGDRTPLGGSSTDRTIDVRAAAFRNKDINPKMQNILQQVQARQSNVQDTAKSQQTNINQSQDASNQLSQMLTSLLQTMQTILSSIYH